MHSPGSCEALNQKAHSAPVVLDEARWPLMAMGHNAVVVCKHSARLRVGEEVRGLRTQVGSTQWASGHEAEALGAVWGERRERWGSPTKSKSLVFPERDS